MDGHQHGRNVENERRHNEISGKLILLTILAVIGGFLFGYDTGVISGANLYLKHEFELTSFQQELIVSATVGAAAIFSFSGGCLNHHLGRKWTILWSSLIFILGSLVLAVAFTFWFLLIGRIIVGIAVGISSTTVPLYLAETSPAKFRGRMITTFQLFITFGMWMASVISAGFSYLSSSLSWRFMLGFAAVPAAIQFIGFLFMPESPRWLVHRRARESEAFRILLSLNVGGSKSEPALSENKLRAIQLATAELLDIAKSRDQELMVDRGSNYSFVDLFKSSTFRRALFIGCSLQLFQQFSGINTIMYYSASIIQMGGITDNTLAIWMSAITSGVNFLATFLGMYLVDKIGRKPLLLSSMLGVIATLLLLSMSFFIIARQSPASNFGNIQIKDHCSNYSNCDACSYDDNCGFCMNMNAKNQTPSGWCLSIQNLKNKTGLCNNLHAGGANDGAEAIYFHGSCPSSFAWLPILGLVLYLSSFSAGFGPMPWTICAEIFPNKVRSLGTSITTAANWTSNLIISLTFLSLSQAITRQGAYLLYAFITIVGLVIFYLVLPETKNSSVDDIEHLLQGRLLVGLNEKLFNKSPDRQPLKRQEGLDNGDYGSVNSQDTSDQ